MRERSTWASPAVVAEAIRDGFRVRGFACEIREAAEPRDIVVVLEDGRDIAYVAADGMVQVHVREDIMGGLMLDGRPMRAA